MKPSAKKSAPKPFVVYVTYPGGTKEYAYLCSFPASQGDIVLGNGNAKCTVVRTASSDPRAKYHVDPVITPPEVIACRRRAEITTRLQEIEKYLARVDRWQALASRSPEAKKLLAEYKKLAPKG